jgi:hypothetical protein
MIFLVPPRRAITNILIEILLSQVLKNRVGDTRLTLENAKALLNIQMVQ